MTAPFAKPLASVVKHNSSDDVIEVNSGSICDLNVLVLRKIRSYMSRNSPFSFLGTKPNGEYTMCGKGSDVKGPATHCLVLSLLSFCCCTVATLSVIVL